MINDIKKLDEIVSTVAKLLYHPKLEKEYEKLNHELRDNEFIVKKLMVVNPNIFKYCSNRLQANKDLVKSVVKLNGVLLKYADEKLKNDEEIIINAIENTPKSLLFTGKNFICNQKFINKYIKRLSYFLEYVPESLKDDKNIALKAIKQNSDNFIHTSEKLKDNKKIALLAVRKKGTLLQYVSKRLQDDEEVCLIALNSEQNGILTHVSERLRNNRNIIAKAIIRNPYAIKEIPINLENSEKLWGFAIDKQTSLMKFAPKELQFSKKFILKRLKNLNARKNNIYKDIYIRDLLSNIDENLPDMIGKSNPYNYMISYYLKQKLEQKFQEKPKIKKLKI